MADKYPVLIAGPFTKEQAAMLVCSMCDRQRLATEAEIVQCEPCISCECGAGFLDWMYVEGDACKSCGKLDYSMELDGCCSRKCQLQVEYAAALKRSA